MDRSKAHKLGILAGLLLMLGAGSPHAYQAFSEPDHGDVQAAAHFWAHDLGPVVATQEVQNGSAAWQVEGSNMSVFMDENLELVEFQFND